MGTYDMLWRDPLSTPGDRFPLGPPPEYWTDCEDEPSEVGIRPYSLRGVVRAPKSEVGPGTTYTYDPRRQITFVYDADGAVVPLSKHTKPGATRSPGTSETTDGDGSPQTGEEMLPPDYQDD